MLGWAVVVLLAFAALGQPAAFAASRWAGGGVGLILAIVITAFSNTRARRQTDGGLFWGCLVIAGLLLAGPHLREWTCVDAGCDPLPYSQSIRLWAVLDTVAVFVYGWTLVRIWTAWRLAAEAE